MEDRVKAKTKAGTRVRDQDQTSLKAKCGTPFRPSATHKEVKQAQQAQQAAPAEATGTFHLVTKRHIEGIKSMTE